MNFPEHYKYTKSHEWVEFLDEATARIGLTDYAQDQLGDLVFVNLPQEGDQVAVGEAFGDVESVKAVSDVYSPVTGVVAEVNEDLLDSPEKINASANEAWLVKVAQIEDQEALMDVLEYQAFLKEQS